MRASSWDRATSSGIPVHCRAQGPGPPGVTRARLRNADAIAVNELSRPRTPPRPARRLHSASGAYGDRDLDRGRSRAQFEKVSGRLLEAEDDFHVVGEARTGSEALALTRHLGPDVVVLDVRLPDRNGIEVCAEIHDLSPTTRVLSVPASPTGPRSSKRPRPVRKASCPRRPPTPRSSTRSGGSPGRLGGRRGIGPSDVPVPPLATCRHARLAQLSDRERQVLGLLSEGLTNREIGTRLFISEKTVRNHVSGLLRKLNLRHRTEAALFAAPLKAELFRGLARGSGTTGTDVPGRRTPRPSRPIRSCPNVWETTWILRTDEGRQHVSTVRPTERTEGSGAIRVAVADDEETVVDVLRSLIGSDPTLRFARRRERRRGAIDVAGP